MPKAIQPPAATTPGEPNALPATKQPSDQPPTAAKGLVNEPVDERIRDNTLTGNLGVFTDAKRLGKLTREQIRAARSAVASAYGKFTDWIIGDTSGNQTWRSPKDYTNFGMTYSVLDFGVGRQYRNGWVAISDEFGGGRTTVGALSALAPRLNVANSTDPREAIRLALATIRSPFSVFPNTNSLGIFIDGTGNHLESITNVTRMYNVYNGTKAYYGGVGNKVDWSHGSFSLPAMYSGWERSVDRMLLGYVENGLGNAFGYGWTEILNRAIDDIRTQRDEYIGAAGEYAEQFVVDIFGFSRGAAMAQDLAYRLEKELPDVKVRFLGMFDPVYSKGLPGPWGPIADGFTTGVEDGNRITRPLPPNVIYAANLAAQHEERTGFRATVTRRSTIDQVLYAFQIPGAHCEVGGYWGSTQFNQAVSFYMMAELARRSGVPIGKWKDMDNDLADYYRSGNPLMTVYLGGPKFVVDIQKSGTDEERESLRTFLEVFRRRFYLWTKEEFIEKIRENRRAGVWIPGFLGWGVQKYGWIPHPLLRGPEGMLQHYERDLQDYKYISDFHDELKEFKNFFKHLDLLRPKFNGDPGWDENTFSALGVGEDNEEGER